MRSIEIPAAPMNKDIQIAPKAFAALTALVLVAPLVAHAVVGRYARYMADDFWHAGTLHTYGLLGSQIWWYMNWTGEYGHSLLVTLASLFGAGAVAYLPGIAVILWVVALGWAIAQWWPNGGSLDLPGAPVLFAALIVYATLETTPNIWQSLYWQNAMLKYVPSAILATIMAGMVGQAFRREQPASRRRTAGEAAIMAFLAFAAAGFSFTYLAVQLLGLGLVWCGLWWSRRRTQQNEALIVVTAALVASLIAAFVMVFTPGNAGRLGGHPAPIPDPVRTVRLVWQQGLYYAGASLLQVPLVSVSAVLIPALWAFMLRRRVGPTVARHERDRRGAATWLAHISLGLGLAVVTYALWDWYSDVLGPETGPKRLLLLGAGVGMVVLAFALRQGLLRWQDALLLAAIPLICASVILAAMLPAIALGATSPPARALIFPQYVLVCSMVSVGLILGGALGASSSAGSDRIHRYAVLAASVLIVALYVGGPLLAAHRILDRSVVMGAYAAAWDERDRMIRDAHESGEMSVIAPALDNPASLDDIEADPHFWVNDRMAIYYGVKEIRAAP